MNIQYTTALMHTNQQHSTVTTVNDKLLLMITQKILLMLNVN